MPNEPTRADAGVGAPPTAERDDNASEARSDESRLEHREVLGDGIKVGVSWWTLTGSTHVAEELVISTEGTLRLTAPDDDEEEGEGDDSQPLPLVDEIYRVDAQRWILVGWSSFGEGMQTAHAWLVADASAPRVVDTLAWTTDRSHGGIVLDVAKKLRVGIPLPVQSNADHRLDEQGDDDEHHLHAQDMWQLAHGKRSYTLTQVVKLPASERHLMTVHAYTPPYGESAAKRGWNGRFVWFSVDQTFVRR